MTFQAQFLRREFRRTSIGALHGAYHGDTLGAVGVGEIGNFMTAIFRPLLLQCERVAVPEDPRLELLSNDRPIDLDDARGSLQAYFAEHGERLAAFIIEPLVQGAGGMRMWPPELVVELRRLCDRYGVYLIFDEVMTGFGRTGNFLACDGVGVAPDVLCLSKGLTGGFLPLALTCATEALFEVFWADPEESRAFLHGHSYTANPIACAVAAASLALFDETPVLEGVAALAAQMQSSWARIARHPATRRARCLGAIAACNLVDPKTGGPRASLQRDGLEIHRLALELGLLVRPIGDCLYLLPPLATPPSRIEEVVDVLVRCLDQL